MLFAILVLSNCAHPGPEVTLCIVDVANNGFQCLMYPSTKTFRPLSQGEALNCVSPHDLEEGLKTCKAGKKPVYANCKLHYSDQIFSCIKPDGTSFDLPLKDADNYACLDDQDKERILERCHTLE